MFFVAASRTHFGGKSKPPCWFFQPHKRGLSVFVQLHSSFFTLHLLEVPFQQPVDHLARLLVQLYQLIIQLLPYVYQGMAGGWKYLLINVKKSNYEAAKPYPRLLFYLLTAAQATSLLRQPRKCYHLWHHPPAHLCQV